MFERFILVLLLVIGFIQPVFAISGKWQEINYKTYILNTNQAISPYKIFWIKKLNDGSSDFKNKKIYYYLTMYIVDCSKNQLKTIKDFVYDYNGDILYKAYSSYNFNNPDSAPLNDIIPNSVGEFYYNSACQSIWEAQKNTSLYENYQEK